jgi:hypothetical protein
VPRIRLAFGSVLLGTLVLVQALAGPGVEGQEAAVAVPVDPPRAASSLPVATVPPAPPVEPALPLPEPEIAVAAEEATAPPEAEPAPEPPPEPEAPALPPPVGPFEAADIVRAAFARFGPEVQDEAVRIAVCESHLNPAAIGHNRDGNAGRHDLGEHSSDWGLMQINSYWNLDRYLPADTSDYHQALDPYWNAQVAADLYGRGGWGLWSTAPFASDVAAYEARCA